MLMSTIEDARLVPSHPELAGKRVLITGLSGVCGIDIVRAFAEHRTRLMLQFAEDDETAAAIGEVAANSALEVESFGPLGPATDDAVQFGRVAAKLLGGVEVVINLVSLAPQNFRGIQTLVDVDRAVADQLRLPYVLSNIIANRMALTYTEGLILNIATLGGEPRDRGHALAGVIRTALAALTRKQAAEWQDRGIRFNAIAPPVAGLASESVLTGEADVAALALHLASSRGKALSGLVFDAEQVARAA